MNNPGECGLDTFVLEMCCSWVKFSPVANPPTLGVSRLDGTLQRSAVNSRGNLDQGLPPVAGGLGVVGCVVRRAKRAAKSLTNWFKPSAGGAFLAN